MLLGANRHIPSNTTNGKVVQIEQHHIKGLPFMNNPPYYTLCCYTMLYPMFLVVYVTIQSPGVLYSYPIRHDQWPMHTTTPIRVDFWTSTEIPTPIQQGKPNVRHSVRIDKKLLINVTPPLSVRLFLSVTPLLNVKLLFNATPSLSVIVSFAQCEAFVTSEDFIPLIHQSFSEDLDS